MMSVSSCHHHHHQNNNAIMVLMVAMAEPAVNTPLIKGPVTLTYICSHIQDGFSIEVGLPTEAV